MGRQTRIEWCDSTVNPTGGCDGCELWNPRSGGSCYAAAIHNRFAGSAAFPKPFHEVVLRPGRMRQAAGWSDLRGTKRPDKPWLDGLPRCIFIGDMGDSFAKGVPLKYLADEVIANVTSEVGRRHRWLWLTKKPKRMGQLVAYLGKRGVRWPENLLPMVSAGSDRQWPRLYHMRDYFGEHWGLSIEPLLGLYDLCFGGTDFGPEWLIVGCESRGSRVGRLWFPRHGSEDAWLDQATALVAESRAQDIPVFVKQISLNGELLHDRWKFPINLQFREMPRIVTGELT